MVTGWPESVPEYEPVTVPRLDADTYPWRPRLSMNDVSRDAEGAVPVVTVMAYL